MLLIVPDSYKQIKNNIDLCDGFILSLDGFSVNTKYKINLNDLKKIMKITKDKEIYLSINKNIENNLVEKLEKILLELNKYPIKGVIYSDVCVLTFKDKLNYELIFGAEHFITNYETINYFDLLGVDGVYLSSDITKDEISDIISKIRVKTFVNLFGYLSMFVSKRNIVKNYLEYFNIKDESKIYYMEKEGKIYPIIDEDETSVFTNYIYNGIIEYFNIKPDYYILNGFLIDDDKFNEVLKLVNNITKENILDINKKINDMFDNVDTGFLYKETVSKVK